MLASHLVDTSSIKLRLSVLQGIPSEHRPWAWMELRGSTESKRAAILKARGHSISFTSN